MLTRIKEYIDFKGITIAAFERSIGMSNASFGKSLKNGGNIGSDKIENILSVYPEINTDWLITGIGTMLKSENNTQSIPNFEDNRNVSLYRLKTDYFNAHQEIPLYELDAVAGLATLFDSQVHQVPLDFIIVPNAPKCDGAIYARGDSMYPIVKSGDIVCFKMIESLENIFYGDIHILHLNIEGDSHLTIKYVQKSKLGEDYVLLVSQNDYHASRDIHKSQIKAIALVKLSIRYNTII